MAGQEIPRIYAVDYLRGLAALAVAWFHLTNQYDPEGIVRQSGAYGWLGVDLFFVISGFVVPYSLQRFSEKYTLAQFPQFMAKRILRLEPTYVASLALVIALAYASTSVPQYQGTPPDFSADQLASHLFYVIPLTEYEWLQPVYWSLAYEFCFYILLGLIFPFVFMRPSPWRFAGICLVIGAAILAGLLDGRWALFIIGMAAYRQLFESQEAWISWILILGATALIALTGGVATAGAGLTAIVLIYFGRNFELSGASRRVLTGLAAISYSLYLVHIPIGGRVVNLGRRFIGEGAMPEAALSLLALTASLAVAWLLYRLVEEPSLRLSQQIRGSLPFVWRLRDRA